MFESITKENFNQLLGRFSTTELENMLNKFPYFHQAHVLLAKKYQQENNPKFDEQLQLAALYTQDREFLFSIFHETNISSDLEVPTRVDEHKKEILVEEKVAVSTLEVKPEEEQVKQEESPVLVQQGVEEVKQTFLVTEPHTFDEWLSAFAANREVNLEIPDKEQITPEPLKQEDELEQLIMSNLPLQDLMEEETHYSKGLDVFIEEQKQRHKSSESRKPSSESELAPELITETMAKIYEAQKKYPKAIRAYEILALKYPEKNDFFAARINYLKNII